MKIAFITPEIKPFSKIGGLADVSLELPKALKKENIDISIFTPMHSNNYIDDYNLNKILNLYTSYEGKIEEVFVYKGEYKNLPIYFIQHPVFSLVNKVYIDPPYKNATRYIFFDLIIAETIRQLNDKIDIIHLNDWTTALIAAYIKTLYKNDNKLSKIKSIYTIHNFGKAYQGIFEPDIMPLTGLPWSYFTPDYLEFYSKLNLTKAGLIFADKITTVSPTYSKEIQTPELGEGLHGLIKLREKDIVGIVNGIDYEIFNPETDPNIKFKFNKDNLENKEKNKEELLKKLELKYNKDNILISMITRITKQKGISLIIEKLPEILNKNITFILLGKGEKDYEEKLKELEIQYPEKVKIIIAFDDVLARQIYASSDLFLMPSYYEPCGIGQLIALKYATIPFVRATGGLKDTIIEYNIEQNKGNGFLFNTDQEFISKLQNILNLYKNKEIWEKLKINALKTDVSWNNSAKKYIKLYKQLIDN